MKFVIAGSPRTGSTYLQTTLNSHSDILCAHEVFGTSENRAHFRLENGTVVAAAEHARSYLESCIWSPSYSRKRGRGFKIFYYHGREVDTRETVWDCLRQDRDIHVIHLVRRNLLARYASQKMAAETGIWNRKRMLACRRRKEFSIAVRSRAKEYRPVELGYEELLENFRYQQQIRRQFKADFSEHRLLELYYEDLMAEPSRYLQQVLAFLGFSFEPLKADNCKLAKGPLSETIVNYRELKERFNDTPWCSFFEE
ncbi:MAG: sulfotransferase [Bdellovibrionales bacterium]|nr:sulfotransferase [Bdellovibrionales bacterium]